MSEEDDNELDIIEKKEEREKREKRQEIKDQSKHKLDLESRHKLESEKKFGVIELKYKPDKNSNLIQMVSDYFYFNNKNKIFFLYKNRIIKGHKLYILGKSEKEKAIKIKIVLLERFIKMNHMFEGCSSLISLSKFCDEKFINSNDICRLYIFRRNIK